MTTGYPSSTSVAQGGQISFHLSNPTAGTRRFRVEEIAASPSSAEFSARVEPRAMPPDAAENGCRWPASHDFTVPADFPSGLYRLLDGTDEILTFVVRAARPGSHARILVQMPFTRDEAYNPTGGGNFYGTNAGDESNRRSRLSFLRPGGYIGSHGPPPKLIRWLERERIAAEYCSNVDLYTEPDLLRNYDCLVLVFHDEYWSAEMRDQVEHFIANGGNMIVLSGNTSFRAIRFNADATRMTFHKYADADTERDDRRVTVAWAHPPLNRPPNRMHGMGFTDGAFGGSPAAAYRIHHPEHWVFEGVDDRETVAFMGYETDAPNYVHALDGYPRVIGDDGTPLNFTILADADLSRWTKPGRAAMGLYSRHGTVFNTGTTDWVHALGDPTIGRITRNVFRRLGRRRPMDWERIGHAFRGVAMTATQGQLFIATDEDKLWRRYPVAADVNWRNIGHANNVMSMASVGDALYCLTEGNRLWWRHPLHVEINWQPIGHGPEGGAVAMAGTGGQLWAIDRGGRLMRRPLAEAGMAVPGEEWLHVARFDNGGRRIVAMTATNDILIAATEDGHLLRSDRDFITESMGWHRFHHCNHATGLAVIEWMLYVATRGHLWQMDLHGLRAP